MKVLFYEDLNYSGVKNQFNKIVDFLKNDDFTSAEVKKLVNTNFFRAKLDYENRLLFKFARYDDQTHVLLLEVIYNHNYDKSRFLRGAKINDNKLIPVVDKENIPAGDSIKMNYINPKGKSFHLLDKIISFDKVQESIFKIKPPVIIIGSAGSGKTVLTLEKVKSLKGNILYVTLSPYLSENSAKLYYSNHYINEKQDVDFLSFKEFLETLKIIQGRELDYKSFEAWLHPRKHSFGIKESYKLFEEFRGVITGMEITRKYLTRDDYLDLGIKQSIFLDHEREKVYEAFTKYLDFLNESDFIDLNIVSYQWLEYCKPKYDFIIIDEVQDFTNIQLFLVLQSLKTSGNFILCGDSNQIVHPNFFSWTNVKTMFYKHDISGSDIKILRTNYRNSIDITNIANRLLMIKNARFGSIDKESTFLVDSIAENRGEVHFFKDTPKIRKQLNEKTGRSTKYAVLVMKSDDKTEVKRIFKTPLLFAIHEAKGLEYENIIIVNFISNNSREFYNITSGVTKEDLKDDSFGFSRGKDKSDKALDAYKFYINSLYVGLTRAVKNIYILETSGKHEILGLLDLVESKKEVSIKEVVSSADDWKKEARKLEMQGKKEQADEIRKSILSIQKPEWEPITPDNIDKLKEQALDPDFFNKKAKDKLFAYSLLYNDIESINKLSELKYKRADRYENERNSVFRKYYQHYQSDNVKAIEQNINKYGVDYRDLFNLTPLLAATNSGSIKIINLLAEYNANSALTDNYGRNPLQIAIFQSYFSKVFSVKLNRLYPMLLTDNIKVKVDDRLIKIDNHKIEYFLLNFFIALQVTIIQKRANTLLAEGVQSGDIVKIISKYPDTILADYRKKRTYISSNLAKNEIDGSNPWNRKIFMRTERGHYVLNPNLDVLINNTWENVYDIMRTVKVKKLTAEEKHEKVRKYFQDDYDNIIIKNPAMAEILRSNISYIDEKLKENEAKKRERDLEKNETKNMAEARRKERLQKKAEKKRLIEEAAKEAAEKRRKADESQYKLPF